MNFFDRFAAWTVKVEAKAKRKAQERHFKAAEKALGKAFGEIVSLTPDGILPNQELNVRRSIRQTLYEVQVYRAHLGLIQEEAIKQEIVRANREIAA